VGFKPAAAQLKGWWNITPWAASTVTAAAAVVRQNATPVIGNERVFVCVVAGTTGGSEPSWTVTRGAKTTDNTATWMEATGLAGLNGDTVNTPTWTAAKNGGLTPSLGSLIQRNNGASYWICTTAGTMGAGEPAWPNDTAGTTQADNTATWTCLGVVGNWTGWQTPCPRLSIFANNGWATSSTNVANGISNKLDIYVASEHAETQALGMSFNQRFGNLASPSQTCRILCVTKSTVPPVSANLTTGGSITTSSNNAIGNLGVGSCVYIQGITILSATGANTATNTLLNHSNGAAVLAPVADKIVIP
jgi:hypothetical protein